MSEGTIIERKVTPDEEIEFLTWLIGEIRDGRMRIEAATADSRGAWVKTYVVDPEPAK